MTAQPQGRHYARNTSWRRRNTHARDVGLEPAEAATLSWADEVYLSRVFAQAPQTLCSPSGTGIDPSRASGPVESRFGFQSLILAAGLPMDWTIRYADGREGHMALNPLGLAGGMVLGWHGPELVHLHGRLAAWPRPWTTAAPAVPQPAALRDQSSAASDRRRWPGCPPGKSASKCFEWFASTGAYAPTTMFLN